MKHLIHIPRTVAGGEHAMVRRDGLTVNDRGDKTAVGYLDTVQARMEADLSA